MADNNKCLGFCCGCELIKTNRVLCEDDFTIPGPFNFQNNVPNQGFKSDADLTVVEDESEANIISTGCRIEFDESNNKFKVVVLGFIICEKVTLTGPNANDVTIKRTIELPVSRICEDFEFTFEKCKFDSTCLEDGLKPKCQLESINGESKITKAKVASDGSTIDLRQSIRNIVLEMKVDQIVQLLVQLCQQTPGTLSVK